MIVYIYGSGNKRKGYFFMKMNEKLQKLFDKEIDYIAEKTIYVRKK